MNIVCKECGWKNPISKEKCNQCNSLLEPDVFISYARADYVDKNGVIIEGNILSGIKETLGNNHITYWFDEDGIYSGEEFASIITSAIRRSKVFLFVSSENSNKSKWTSNEISTAQEYSKPIIPFKIDESKYNDSIMMKIVSIDYIQYKNGKQSLLKLIRALRHYLPQQYTNSIEQTFVMPDGVKGATIMLDMGNEVVEHVLSPEFNKEVECPYNVPIEHASQTPNEEINVLERTETGEFVFDEQDSKVPLVLFIGPQYVGKTSVVTRLSKYIISNGWNADITPNFKGSIPYDMYMRVVRNMDIHLLPVRDCSPIYVSARSYYPGDDGVIRRYGDDIRLIDLPYDIFFSKTEEFPLYFKQIVYSKNPKIWIIILEPGWEDSFARRSYVESIDYFKKKIMSSSDKVVFLINKVDNTPFVDGRDNVKMEQLLIYVEDIYPNIFKPFLRRPTLLQFFKSKYTCDILPFSAGTLSGDIFVPASDCYPKKLWDVIDGFIKEYNFK